MNDQQLQEGVREVVMALLTLGSNIYTSDYILDQLEKRKEPLEQKIDAIKFLDKKINDSRFDDTVDSVLTYYGKKSESPVFVKPKKKHLPASSIQSPDYISPNLLTVMKNLEQFHPTPYWDYKQYSIGYGTKALPKDKSISEKEAERRLIKILKKHRMAVYNESRKWGYNWSPSQIDALTSFRYNIGSLSNLTNNGTRTNKQIAKKILEYNKAGGKVLNGLTKRRMIERDMFLDIK